MKIFSILETFVSKIHTIILSMQNGVRIGKGTSVYRKSNIVCKNTNGGGVKIGENCLIGRSSKGYHAGMPFYTNLFCDTPKATIEIGNNCRINGAYIHAQNFIKIGDNCVLASGINIIDSNGHEINSLNRTKGRDNPSGIIIGDNVWIGLNAIILKGSVIGNNSVISAGSIVKGEVPSDVIYSTNHEVTIKKIMYK